MSMPLRVYSVLMIVAMAAAGCGRRLDAPPEVTSPPLFTSELMQAKPPPPEERETTAQPLDSARCTASDTTVLDSTNVEVVARCKAAGATTRVLLTVVPRTTDPADYLRQLSFRFCGTVLGATGPSGWSVGVTPEKGRSEVAAEVVWRLENSDMPSPQAGARMDGFAVSLQGEWRRGVGYFLLFNESGGIGALSPHDCPYPHR